MLKDLQSRLHYNPKTGIFYWLKGRRRGRQAGTLCSYGYVKIGFNRKLFMAHRLAFLFMEGEMPPEEVDHINGVRSDNRWENLRHASHNENFRNQQLSQKNKYGIPGVYLKSPSGRWAVKIHVNGMHKHIGTFESLFEAACARKSAENKYGYHPNHGRNPVKQITKDFFNQNRHHNFKEPEKGVNQ